MMMIEGIPALIEIDKIKDVHPLNYYACYDSLPIFRFKSQR
jgi:hypothetical protein